MLQRIITYAFLFSGLIVLGDLAFDIMTGGNVWRQGDWLINSNLEHVRRGLLGSWVIALADMLAISPLYALAVLQTGLAITLFAATAVAFAKAADRREYLLLLASPSFIVIFWITDPYGALRKELIAYCALALLLMYPIYRSKALIVLATAVFVLGCMGHEANTLFLPLFAVMLFLVSAGAQDRRLLLACGLVASIGAVIGFAYAVHFSAVSDTAVICRPLLERGLKPILCQGPIGWVGRDTTYALEQVAAKMDRPDHVLLFPLYYLLAFSPIFYFASLTKQPRRLYLAYALCGLPFLPLFAVALDWGRWLSFHVTSTVMLTLALGLTGRLHFAKSVSMRLLLLFVVGGLIWAPENEAGLMLFGMIGRLVFGRVI
jgi:hypothetical protein